MNDELTMAIVYAGMTATATFLFRRAPDEPQRIAMLVLTCAFVLLTVTMIAAALNGYSAEMRDFLRLIGRTGRDFMQTGLAIILLRLVWKEWVCAPLPPS